MVKYYLKIKELYFSNLLALPKRLSLVAKLKKKKSINKTKIINF